MDIWRAVLSFDNLWTSLFTASCRLFYFDELAPTRMIHSLVILFPANKYHSRHCNIMGCGEPVCCLIRLGQPSFFLLIRSFILTPLSQPGWFLVRSSLTNTPSIVILSRWGSSPAILFDVDDFISFEDIGSTWMIHCCPFSTPTPQYHEAWGARRYLIRHGQLCSFFLSTFHVDGIGQLGWSLVRSSFHRPTNISNTAGVRLLIKSTWTPLFLSCGEQHHVSWDLVCVFLIYSLRFENTCHYVDANLFLIYYLRQVGAYAYLISLATNGILNCMRIWFGRPNTWGIECS